MALIFERRPHELARDLSIEAASPRWWVPLLLAAPAIIPLLNSLVVAHLTGQVATGFIHHDQPSYVATARDYFDEGFHLLARNRYAGYDTPRIYFQPQLFLVGCFLQLGLDPGLTWAIASMVGVLFAAFVAVRFYREVVGWRGPAEKLGLVCFFWGGGIFVLIGLVHAAIVGRFNAFTILQFDPGIGWWMLNFGRNLVYGPTEAYYHGLVLLCLLCLVVRRYAAAIALAILLSLSHPWTGLETSVLVAAYFVVERLYGDRGVKPTHIAISVALPCLHVGYYLLFLNQFADHRALFGQWQQLGVVRNWLYPASTFVPALFLVGLLALARLWRWPGVRQVIEDRRNRLFILAFLVVFGFTQHYRVMEPIQPIHFAHGYDWIALFFLGAPLLVTVLDRLLKVRPRWLAMLAVCGLVGLFLSDNLLWFATFVKPNVSEAVIIAKEQKEVLQWLNPRAVPREMVVTADPTVAYLIDTYTPIRSWAAFPPSTPDFDARNLEIQQAFQSGVILPAWQNMHVFYVQRTLEDRNWTPPAGTNEVFHNAKYNIWEYPGKGAADVIHEPPQRQ
jgi:xanthosine utilization system XapX-like protein